MTPLVHLSRTYFIKSRLHHMTFSRLLLQKRETHISPTMALLSHSSTFLLPSTPSSDEPSRTYALVLLNRPLLPTTPLLWTHSKLRLLADGGSNRVYDEMPLLFPNEDPVSVRNRYKPNAIIGDLDSIRAEVREFYTNLGTLIVDLSAEQDTTDLHKCINFVRDFTPNLDKSNLCVLVGDALGGRFDHEMGNINVLSSFLDMRIVLLSEACLILLLSKNYHHEINILPDIEGPQCGLIPIGTSSSISTTTGLQWDLNDTEMHFGGLISTSNIVREKITVRSDSDLLWTISIRKQI